MYGCEDIARVLVVSSRLTFILNVCAYVEYGSMEYGTTSKAFGKQKNANPYMAPNGSCNMASQTRQITNL